MLAIETGQVGLWSLETGQLRREFEAMQEPVRHAWFTNDGNAICVSSREVRKIDTATGKPLWRNTLSAEIHCAELSSSERWVAV